ncbi:MAG: hypothetical protein WB660_10965 [Candidatus Sulfotelmatobacter sp.]
MLATIQVGTILTNDSPMMTQLLGLQSETYSGSWSLINVLDGLDLDRNIHVAGWNFFFMAAEVKVMFWGALGAKKLQNAMQRILTKVKPQHFNGIEITGIVAKHFLGARYTVVTAHSRHIQQSCYLDNAETRRTYQHNREWAKG